MSYTSEPPFHCKIKMHGLSILVATWLFVVSLFLCLSKKGRVINVKKKQREGRRGDLFVVVNKQTKQKSFLSKKKKKKANGHPAVKLRMIEWRPDGNGRDGPLNVPVFIFT